MLSAGACIRGCTIDFAGERNRFAGEGTDYGTQLVCRVIEWLAGAAISYHRVTKALPDVPLSFTARRNGSVAS